VPDHPYFNDDEIMVIAHRGGVNLWPENTIYAFERAVELGVDVLEMDVRASADGHLVLLHDETVDRTTNGSGRVDELSLAEIQALDAGYNWPDRIVTREREITGDDYQRPFGNAAPPEGSDSEHPYRGLGIGVPTLEEVLAAFPDARMVVELKSQDPNIIGRFVEIMREADRGDRTLLATFYPETMYAMREALPEYASSGVDPEIRPFVILDKLGLAEIFRPEPRAFQVPEYAGGLRVITPSMTRSAERLNVHVDAWSAGSWDGPIVSKQDMRRLIDAGVDGLITDRPDLLLEVLGRR
jgi:glycerophosphoryl diester phosphodiesterase